MRNPRESERSYTPCGRSTLRITGSKKQSEERATLFAVRVHAIVIRVLAHRGTNAVGIPQPAVGGANQ
jgi:hypothetical protein